MTGYRQLNTMGSFMAALGSWARGWLVPTLMRRRSFRFATYASLAAILYWGVIASDRYVSEAHVVIQNTSQVTANSAGASTPLGGSSSASGALLEQMLLRDHLLSVDMLNKLDAALNLRAHYSQWRRDPLSRMWIENRSQELFHRYFLSRVSVELDMFAGVLVIKAQAFDPATAHAIASLMVEEGERHMNQMGHRIAQKQVQFLEKQVVEVNRRMLQANQEMLAFQNKKGMVSPQDTVTSMAAVVNNLESQKTALRVRRTELLGYLSATAPSVQEIDFQIEALDRQIAQENERLTSSGGKSLNSAVEEYQRLQMTAAFQQDLYKSALAALEQGRLDSARTLAMVSVLQAPTLPQYPLEPTRIYNITVFILAALMLAGIVNLLAAIIRDHKD